MNPLTICATEHPINAINIVMKNLELFLPTGKLKWVQKAPSPHLNVCLVCVLVERSAITRNLIHLAWNH